MKPWAAGITNWDQSREEALASSGGFKELPDGLYEGRLTSCRIAESQSGRAQIVAEYTVDEGEHAGTVARQYQGLHSDQSLTFVFRWLTTLGVDISDMTPELLEIALGDLTHNQPRVTFAMVTKNGYHNLYVRELLQSCTVDVPAMEDPFSGDSGGVPATSKDKDKDEDTSDVDDLYDEEEDEEAEEAEEDEEEIEVQVGMVVQYPWKGQEVSGTVREVLEDSLKVATKEGNSTKIRTIKAENAVIVL